LAVASIRLGVLDAVTAEIEAHVAAGGWEQATALFALVPTAFVAADPTTAPLLGLAPGTEIPSDSLTPVAQEPLPDEPLDDTLAGIEWPDSVTGCALAQEIVVLPPSAEADLPGTEDDLQVASAHPDRREARLVVAVTKAGATSCVLRLRAPEGSEDEIAFGADLAPRLAEALRETLN
jgi:hypothetical protein